MSVYENFSKPIRAAINRKANRLAQDLVPRIRIALATQLVDGGIISTNADSEWRADEMLVAVDADVALEGVRDIQVRALLGEIEQLRAQVRALQGVESAA